jgi:hypothetical protein
MKKTAIILTLFALTSCGAIGFYNDGGLLNRGKRNEYGQYVPKKPKYKLRDKKNNIIPENLDTTNIYRRSVSTDREKYNYIHFIKFYPAGRYLSISIPAKDDFGFDNRLQERDFNPQNPYVRKGYYHSKDGKKGKIETFYEAYTENVLTLMQPFVLGKYDRDKFFLNPSGDTLTIDGKTYIKENIPAEWKKYAVDW